ncbi:molybdopterin molybdotransferase MoeA [Luethyella okanaganae]|uniref:Molybdopterin molybdenumtransferase n=1 Tax=Luethyella okanaganae TaxID=69372 RepID=A0ABW1VC91_9MICO
MSDASGTAAPTELVTVDEQLARVLATVGPLAPVRLPLAGTWGLTLAGTVTSSTDIPVFDNSAMDGYAVRHADTETASAGNPVVLDVIADIPAGSDHDPFVPTGAAARIMTGAPVPSSTDTIVPLEHTDSGTVRVAITTAPRPSAHIRRAGEDVRAGDAVLEPGVLLTPFRLAAAAAAGSPTLLVRPAPRTAVIATGSELVPPGTPLERGQIPDSNSLLLASLVAEAGGVATRVGTVRDDADALRAELEACRSAGVDLVVLSGGVSVGAYDVVKAVLAPLAGVDFISVAMQPGKPQAFGVLPDGTPVFGLPGNPVSAAVSFEVFVRPALLRMQGRSDIFRPTLRATAHEGWRTPPGRRQYMPVIIDREDAALPRVRQATRGGSGSHLVGGLASADGFAVVPAEASEVLPGDILTVMRVRS